MTRLIEIAVEFSEDDCRMVPVTVDASYEKDDYTQDYVGRWHKIVSGGWVIDDFIWNKTQYTQEQNEAILEACFMEESKILDQLNEEQ
jgi:hypothetical protein